MLGSLVVSFLLTLSASPARAGAKEDLCEMANAPSCPGYGTYTPPPQYHEPRERPERCIPCEEEAERELEYNIAHMEHPIEAPTLSGDHLAILNEDVEAANAGMEAIDVALEAVIAAPALEAALTIGVTLIALDAAVSIAAIAFPDYVHVPPWLNLLSLTHAVADVPKECADAIAAAQAACAALPTSECAEGDTCRELLDKRAGRLACDHAWQNARDTLNGKCKPASAEYESWTNNTREVTDCGLMISNKPECCPSEVKDRQDSACPRSLKFTCNDENDMSNADLLGLGAAARLVLCGAALAKQVAGEACRTARVAIGDQCYEGKLDAGHAKQVKQLKDGGEACGAFLNNARTIGVCP